MKNVILLLGILTICGVLSATELPTPKRPVTDEYHKVKVTEDYRWLEKTDDPEVRKWTEDQNTLTRAWLDAKPQRAALREKIQEYYQKVSPNYYGIQFRNGLYFALKLQPPKDQPMLVVLKSPDAPASESIIIDPNVKHEKGLLAIDWFVPSLDGKLVAVAMSEKGSEDSTLYFYDVATGKETGEQVPRVNYPTAGGSAAWTPDNSGVYYTRYPQGEERSKEDVNFFQQIWFHKLGTPSNTDVYCLGKDFPRIAETDLHSRDDGKYVLATVANGDGGEYAHYLMSSDGKWTQVTRFEDQGISGELGMDGFLYLLSRKNAPRGKILRMPLDGPLLASATTIVPEGEFVIVPANGITLTKNKLFVTYLAGGPNLSSMYDLQGKPLGQIPLPPVPSVQETVALDGDDVLLRVQTYVEPSTWYRFSGKDEFKPTALAVKSPVSFDDTEVVREFAPSKDGTKVPLNIIRKKGTKLDGSNPALLYAYGGYGISMSPRYLNILGRLWLDHGGVYVVANLRGGGELGEEWHKAGNLTKKQNVFDDFIGAAEYLIAQKYTTPANLVIQGGSNGGLLMGAVLTQRPELFKAVVGQVGIYDMLRVELSPNGAFNVTEFGTVKDPDHFKALYEYSPYHHVKEGTTYPAILLMTGEHDGRVDPMHSRKMTARLQAATGSKQPVLLRISFNSGHGMGTALTETIDQTADFLAFFLEILGK